MAGFSTPISGPTQIITVFLSNVAHCPLSQFECDDGKCVPESCTCDNDCEDDGGMFTRRHLIMLKKFQHM